MYKCPLIYYSIYLVVFLLLICIVDSPWILDTTSNIKWIVILEAMLTTILKHLCSNSWPQETYSDHWTKWQGRERGAVLTRLDNKKQIIKSRVDCLSSQVRDCPRGTYNAWGLATDGGWPPIGYEQIFPKCPRCGTANGLADLYHSPKYALFHAQVSTFNDAGVIGKIKNKC